MRVSVLRIFPEPVGLVSHELLQSLDQALKLHSITTLRRSSVLFLGA
jgi:hypothetical protein